MFIQYRMDTVIPRTIDILTQAQLIPDFEYYFAKFLLPSVPISMGDPTFRFSL